MPYGFLLNVALIGTATILALAPIRRPRPLAVATFWIAVALNELPLVALALLLGGSALAVAEGDASTPAGATVLAGAGLTAVGLLAVAGRGLAARRTVQAALVETLGPASLGLRQLPWARVLLLPFVRRRHDVRRAANIRYGEAGRRNLLDVYHHRSLPAGGPVLIHLHGGAFRSGRKNTQSLPLIYRLASQGWVCISANYRRRPSAGLPDHLADVRNVIAWVHRNAGRYGADAGTVFVAGTSAGAHLAAMATSEDPSLSGIIALGGYYGPYPGTSSSPEAFLRPGAPPFFIAHGDRDPLVPVEDVRRFVARVREYTSVVYVELRHGQHTFDLFYSPRFDAVINGFEAWAHELLRSARGQRKRATLDPCEGVAGDGLDDVPLAGG